MTLEEMETEIGKVLHHPEQQFLQQASRVLEAGLLKRGKISLQRSKQLHLDFLSRFSWIRLKRLQMRDALGRFACPLVQIQKLTRASIQAPGSPSGGYDHTPALSTSQISSVCFHR